MGPSGRSGSEGAGRQEEAIFPEGQMDFPRQAVQSTGNLKARGQKLSEAIQANCFGCSSAFSGSSGDPYAIDDFDPELSLGQWSEVRSLEQLRCPGQAGPTSVSGTLPGLWRGCRSLSRTAAVQHDRSPGTWGFQKE